METELRALIVEIEQYMVERHAKGMYRQPSAVDVQILDYKLPALLELLLKPKNPAYDSPDGWWLRLSGEQRTILYERYPEMDDGCSSVPDSGADEHAAVGPVDESEDDGYTQVYEKISVAEESMDGWEETIQSPSSRLRIEQGNVDFLRDFFARVRVLMDDHVKLLRDYSLVKERPDIYTDTSPRENAEPVGEVMGDDVTGERYGVLYGSAHLDGLPIGAKLYKLPPQAGRDQPEIVCLCGSSRFTAEMAVIGWELEKEGKVVLGLHLLPDWYTTEESHQAEAEGVAEQMDELHLRKIDMADRVLVVNVGGYIGDSTRREIGYAGSTGKPITYIEPVDILATEGDESDE